MPNNQQNKTGKEDKPLTRADVEQLLLHVGSSKRLDLSGQHLQGSNLALLDLSGANLSGADLSASYLPDFRPN